MTTETQPVVTTIEVHLDNDETVTMSFERDLGWQQWGAQTSTCYRTMPIAEALAGEVMTERSIETLAEVIFGPNEDEEG